MSSRRPSWPLKPPTKRWGYPTRPSGTRVLAVLKPRRRELAMVDPWSAWWMDRGQVAGSTFTPDGTRCGSLEPRLRPGDQSPIPEDWSRRMAWDDVPEPVRAAVLAAMDEWDASAKTPRPAQSTACRCLAESSTCPRFIEEGTGKELHVLACPTCGDSYIGEKPAQPCAECASIAETRRRTAPAPGGR